MRDLGCYSRIGKRVARLRGFAKPFFLRSTSGNRGEGRRKGSQNSANPYCGSFGQSHCGDRRPVQGPGLQADHGGLPQTSADGNRTRAGRSQGDQSHMGRTVSDARLAGITRGIAYRPLPSQQKFHDSKARFKGFSGPIGSGKSQAVCHEAIRLCYVNQGRLGLLGAPTYPMLRDATQAALFEILVGNKIPFDHNKAENTLVMGDTRSKILFRPMDEFERLRGTNLAWFGLDELTYTQEEAWLRLEGRLRDPKANRLCGFAAWTPKGYDWVYRKFLAKPVKGYEAIIAQPLENRYLLHQIPDYYERLKNSYDDRFYQQEVLGLYLNLNAALVYASFGRNENLADLSLDPALPLLWALDFNVDPMSSLVVQLVRGRVLVLDEIVLRHATTHEACAEFLKRFPIDPAGIVVYGDASGYQQHTTGASDYDMIREYFRIHSTMPVKYRVP